MKRAAGPGGAAPAFAPDWGRKNDWGAWGASGPRATSNPFLCAALRCGSRRGFMFPLGFGLCSRGNGRGNGARFHSGQASAALSGLCRLPGLARLADLWAPRENRGAGLAIDLASWARENWGRAGFAARSMGFVLWGVWPTSMEIGWMGRDPGDALVQNVEALGFVSGLCGLFRLVS